MTTPTMIAAPGQQRAKDYAASFTYTKRENEEIFWHHKEDTPEEFIDITRDAHDDELPNDWRYATCSEIADAIVEGGYQTHEDVIEDVYAIADPLVEVYNMQLLQWSCHLNRQQYIDEALSELVLSGANRTHGQLLRLAQHECIVQMIYSISADLFTE